MWFLLSRSRTYTGSLITAALIAGLCILSGSMTINTNLVWAEETAELTENQALTTPNEKTPYANALTQLAAPTATEGPTIAETATSGIPTNELTATPLPLSASDAIATITNQQAQIKALQDQLASTQGDKGATIYAVVIIVIGTLLAFAVFFGLRRGKTRTRR